MILKVTGLALIIAICAVLLRSFGFKGVPVFISVGFLGMLAFGVPYLNGVGEVINSIGERVGNPTAVRAVLKVVGIGYVSGICSDVCKELDAPSVSSAVVLVGRIEIIAVVAPFFEEIVRMGGELIG